MERFKNKMYVPPGGQWFYEVPETKAFFASRDSMRSLLKQVEAHYVGNKMPVPSDLEALVENHMCPRLPDGFCLGVRAPSDRKYRPMTFFSIVKFTQTLVSRLFNNGDFFVDRAEAERRSKICVTCPENYRGICTTCNGLRAIAAGLIGNRPPTSNDSRLEVCAVCGCTLRAKLQVNRKYLHETVEHLKEYPAHCWMLEEQPK